MHSTTDTYTSATYTKKMSNDPSASGASEEECSTDNLHHTSVSPLSPLVQEVVALYRTKMPAATSPFDQDKKSSSIPSSHGHSESKKRTTSSSGRSSPTTTECDARSDDAQSPSTNSHTATSNDDVDPGSSRLPIHKEAASTSPEQFQLPQDKQIQDEKMLASIAPASRQHPLSDPAAAIAFLDQLSKKSGEKKKQQQQPNPKQQTVASDSLQQMFWREQEQQHRKVVQELIQSLVPNEQQQLEASQTNHLAETPIPSKTGQQINKKKSEIEDVPLESDSNLSTPDNIQSGSTFLPCCARAQNRKTAYFVIPKDVQHGEDLICSHLACRNAGIKFNFCSYCKILATKQNFDKQHRHKCNTALQQVLGNNKNNINGGNNSINSNADQISAYINIGNRNRGAGLDSDQISSLTSSSNNHSDEFEEAVSSTDSDDKNVSNSYVKSHYKRSNRIRKAKHNTVEMDRLHHTGGVAAAAHCPTSANNITAIPSSIHPSCDPQLSLSSLSNPNSFPSSNTSNQIEESAYGNNYKSCSLKNEKPRGTKRSRSGTVAAAAAAAGSSGTTNSENDLDDSETSSMPKTNRKKWIKNWVSLLHERPVSDDKQVLSDWLLKVLSTSHQSTISEEDAASLSNILNAIDTQPTRAFCPRNTSSSLESDTSTVAESKASNDSRNEDSDANTTKHHSSSSSSFFSGPLKKKPRRRNSDTVRCSKQLLLDPASAKLPPPQQRRQPSPQKMIPTPRTTTTNVSRILMWKTDRLNAWMMSNILNSSYKLQPIISSFSSNICFSFIR